jgi:hypothetical protein
MHQDVRGGDHSDDNNSDNNSNSGGEDNDDFVMVQAPRGEAPLFTVVHKRWQTQSISAALDVQTLCVHT